MVRAKFAGATELPQSSGAGTLAAAVGGEAEWCRGQVAVSYRSKNERDTFLYRLI